jgi:hypothetical protein
MKYMRCSCGEMLQPNELQGQYVQWPGLVGGKCPRCSSDRSIEVSKLGVEGAVGMSGLELLHNPKTGKFSLCAASDLKSFWGGDRG